MREDAAAAGARGSGEEDSVVTTDSIDTGERRPVGPFVARHIKTTRVREWRHRARYLRSVEERDGWYIDLPVDCYDWAARLTLWDTIPAVPSRRMVLRGNGRRGYAIEETTRQSDAPPYDTNAVPGVARTELVDVSTTPLDPSLFTVPPGYRQALPRWYGGFDMSKPDTMTNRLQSYWQVFVGWSCQQARAIAPMIC